MAPHCHARGYPPAEHRLPRQAQNAQTTSPLPRYPMSPTAKSQRASPYSHLLTHLGLGALTHVRRHNFIRHPRAQGKPFIDHEENIIGCRIAQQLAPLAQVKFVESWYMARQIHLDKGQIELLRQIGN